jgi:hypothetical protein
MTDPPPWLKKLHPSLWPLALGQDRVEARPRSLRVILRFTGPADRLGALGMSVTAVAGDIATGMLRGDMLASLAAAPEVLAIEPSRPLHLST